MKICLILCDSLRYDRVNLETMPNVSVLKQNGVSFEYFFANGGTTKWSMPHFLSGQSEYDPVNNFPKQLTHNGISNMIVHSNAVLVSEHYQDCFRFHKDVGVEMAPIEQTVRNRLRHNPIWKATRRLRNQLKGNSDTPYRLAENIFKSAQKQIDLHDTGFYWIHLMDPHIPYVSPSLNDPEKSRAEELYEKILSKDEITEIESQELAFFYDAECQYMDAEIGKFVDANPGTVFIITSDHGEMFGETGSYSHGPYYHGMTFQLGHIPFVVYGLGVKENHIVTDYHASIEVGSTILDLFELNPVNGYGKSFKKEIMK